MLSNVPKNVIFWTEDENFKKFVLRWYQIKTNCSDLYFAENTEIAISYKNIIETSIIEGYHYEYTDIYYDECPNGSYPFDNFTNESNNIIKCLDKAPEGYYLDINDKKFKKCFENCKLCYGEGNETINNCEECKSNFDLFNGWYISYPIIGINESGEK